MSIPVDDDGLKRALLDYLIRMIADGHIDPLLEAGLSPELLDDLRNRPVRDIQKVAQMSLGVVLKLEPTRLSTALMRLDAMTRNQVLLEYFITHGAAPDMLTRLFKVSDADQRSWRDLLCAQSGRRGRPTMPEPNEREAIHATWSRLQSANNDPREQYFLLHQAHPTHSIATLWAVVHEFSDEQSGRGGHALAK